MRSNINAGDASKRRISNILMKECCHDFYRSIFLKCLGSLKRGIPFKTLCDIIEKYYTFFLKTTLEKVAKLVQN